MICFQTQELHSTSVNTFVFTVKPALKDHPISHKNGLSRQMVFGDRFTLIEMDLLLRLLKTGGLSWRWSLQTGLLQ